MKILNSYGRTDWGKMIVSRQGKNNLIEEKISVEI